MIASGERWRHSRKILLGSHPDGYGYVLKIYVRPAVMFSMNFIQQRQRSCTSEENEIVGLE